ncbi:A kinase (PRKA) anchor protein 1b [Gouania willdenowi]|uniref:Tudor domain-containing protein n=1 Tax=Gouania willdenowi TaxID=441366 RepID=A0A8C5G9Q9_GOUWI|nr:A-kinase anchor protein 1, mitochondrial [Gouania willdenowi]XP_028321095.1 A-kinase anchor protein 1, mitochondrial [Gouania willdenowi]
MPLRFRSIIPYTLPGVLALIGWWWYISRKKDRLVSNDAPERTSPAVGIKTSSAEGSNGLVEKATVSQSNETESPAHRPAKVINQSTQHENVSHIPVQDTEAALSLEFNLEEAVPNFTRVGQKELFTVSDVTVPTFGKEEKLQIFIECHVEPERTSLLASETEVGQLVPGLVYEATVEEPICSQSTKFTSSYPMTPLLSEVQRPDPEGEVATHHNTICTQEETSCCVLTPLETPPESKSLEISPSVPDFTATSTPNAHVLTSAPQGFTTFANPVKSLLHLSTKEQGVQDLELLAAELITEVISAATQEVLAVTSCKTLDISRSCGGENISLVSNSSRLQSLQESNATMQEHHLAVSVTVDHDCSDVLKKENQGVSNGCATASVWEPLNVNNRLHQTDDTQMGPWPMMLRQALQSPCTVLAEDSACSTCHSDDVFSNEDLQNSVLLNQSDTIQGTHLSARDAMRSECLAETVAEAAISVISEEDSMDAECEIKGLNSMGQRNGAHRMCEAETDQSGGSDVNSMDSVDSGCTMGAGESQSNHASSTSELIVWEIEVPKHLVGRLIGKQGRYVSLLKQNSGAKIYIFTLPYTQEFQICHIEGTQQQVDKALLLIGKKFKDLDLTNLYAPPPPPLTLPSLPITSWLLLPSGVTVEVIVVNIVSAGHVFVQQHTHPTYHALRSLDQQMFMCYSQPGTPALPSPAEVGVICAAPAVEGAWWRAQVITFYKDTNEVEIRYVDYGGYDRVKIDSLRQIRSDFVTLPFQGAEVLLDNIAPLPGEDRFSTEATSALEEMTRGVALLAQVSNYDNHTGLPLVHLWNMAGDEVISVNRTLAERGLGVWVEGL